MKFRNLLILLLFLPGLTLAKTLSKEEITTLGVRAFQQKAQFLCPEALSYSLKNCQYLENNGVIDLAILHFDSGFLIFSAEDAVLPVLAYSFTNDFDLDNPASGAQLFIAQYQQEIATARRNHATPSEKVKKAWDNLLHPSKDATAEAIVPPLLHSTWNQNKYYNDLCPEDENAPSGYDGKVPNGCVAIAMSQIMYYYRFPESGTGSHTNHTEYGNFHVNFAQQHYDYDVMCDKLSFYNNEVAKLIFHCGTAIDMMYGPDGSGAYSQEVPEAMASYFRYNTDAQYVSKHHYSDSSWHVILRADLDILQPIYYSGYSEQGGHAFVCDGYNSDDYFHFNFGWGGASNGFYATQSTDDNDYAVGGYSHWQSAIVNLHPTVHSYPTYCNDRILTAANGSLEDGSGNQNYLDNLNCTYVITHPNQYDVRVTLKQCSTQESHDFLRFWDGYPSQENLLLEISGEVLSEVTHTFITDSLYITFETDDSITGKGWHLTFESQREGFGCGANIVKENSGVITDNSGDNNYRDNLNCSWTFRLKNVETLTFNFEEMDISPEDHLDFYDIQTIPHVLLARFSGSTLPDPMTFDNIKIRVKFTSDNYLSEAGFRVTWSADGAGIENHEIPVSVYPNPASDMLHLVIPAEVGQCDITVYSMSGQALYTQHFMSVEGEVEIPVHQLSNGIYMLQMESESNTTHKKIVVVH
ncbi:MAG: C10 family peptidase [Bacteroidales bacterium]|nr:C10 family peptidase [Bacteroidales bacterium]